MATVIARGLTKRFETTCALDGVDLTVEAGEVRGLLGANGAGKTTLLRILLGLVRPDAGTIELLGHRLDEAHAPALAGVSGFVEDPRFYPYLSGRANLELLAQLDGEGSQAHVENVLERLALAARGGERVSGYSSGMRQRLGIAAALLREPRLLLLDEPTTGLDPAGIRFVARLLRELAESGVAVLLSSHQIGEVEAICDTYTVLARGRVVWDGTSAQMRAEAPPSAYSIHTSDDAGALAIAGEEQGVRAVPAPGGGLTVEADGATLDRFVLALGRAGVAVRRLELTTGSLESMFFALTGQPRDDPTPALAAAC